MVRSGSTSSVGAKSPSSNNNNGMSADDLEILSVAIMETIRRIRAQKQRPSLERISKWVMAHTAAKDRTFQQVHEQLEAMSASGRVLKVFNQGEYSYRDPETMTPRTCGRTPKHWKEAKQRNSPLTTPKTHKSLLISPTSPKIASPELTLIPRNSLMRHKTLQVTDYIKLVQVSLDGLSQPEGATIKDMDKYLETTYYIEGISAIEFSRHLRLACKRLVNAGRLMRDGLVFRLSTNPPITPEAKTTNGATNSEEKSENKPLASPLPLLVCSYCCGTEQCNKDGNAESLLSCVDCGNSGHPSCMKVSPDLAANLRGDLKWQCIECKSCQVCGSKGNADNLLFCDSCDRGIHMECCTPPLTKMPKGTFVCELCKTSDVHKKRDLEHGKLPSRGPGRPPHAQRRLLAPGTTPPRSTGSMKNGAVGEQPQEVLSESGQHFLQVPFDKKPKGLIDGMTKFFTPSMGGRKTMTSQARTTQLMIMKQSGVTASDCTSANEDEENINDKTTDPAKKSCKANITEVDENMFFRAREESLQRTGVVEGKNPDPSAARCPENIEFGKYSIETWYSSPYPQEYARLKRLYLCEFCLKYMKSRAILHRHAKKCQWFHPPANEIYRSNNLSVFEVDGNVSKIYCQNLCLLAKLFLDHKTLYYDVEPFSFYCLTINDSKGCHLIGYFSKEKHCQQKYNVSCIMTMPQYQRQGYGRFLIDFSYLLSRKEGQAGSPEKPLSDLGQVSYNAYWKSALLEFLSTRTQTKLISLRDISKATGICPHDVASALQSLGMIKVLKSKDENFPQQFKFNLSRKRQVLSEYMNKREGMRNDPTRPPRPTLDPDCLRWTPLVASTSFLSDESGLRSPSTTPEKRPPLAPTSRLNLSATNKQESASVESHNSSDIENIQVTLSAETNDSNHDSVEAKENLPTLSEAEKTILNQPITTMDLKPSNQDEPITMQDLSDSNQDRPITNDDISKGFLPPSSVVQRKRGRPRKNPGMGLMEPEGPEEGSSPGSLNSRKKRRRKVKGYPWGKVKKKKKKKKFIDNSSDKLDTSDSEKPTRGNGWRMGGPHFSSESEEENDKDEDLKHPPLEASDTMSSEMSQIDTNSIEDVPEPPESCSPENFAALSQMRKRRRRKSKGYQWGTKKRKIKKTFVSVLRRVTGGAVAKHNNQPKISGLVAEKLKEVTTKVDTKKPKQTTMDRFFQPKPTFLVANEASASSSNNNNINITASKSSTEMKSLSNALIDSKHVVVASVTILPTKSPLKQQLTSPETKRKQSALISPGSEPKQRRRSAIASDNFVASCLLSTRTPRRETLEKKRPRGRPRINFPPELETAPNSLEDQSPPQEVDEQRAESSDVKESFLAQSPHIQNEAVSNNKPKAEGTVAFAQPWIANVSSGSSNVAQSSHNSFTLAHEGRFKDMSFKAANTNALGQNKKVKAAINWQSPSLTTYRDMNQINDEDIDISSSSSSEAESSSCSSAESSCDNSSDEEQNVLHDVGEDLSSTNQQWRGSEKTKRLMKTSSQSSEKQEDVGATGPVRERLGVKRGRGRPRKYPPKDPSGFSEKIKVKKKSKKVEEVREKIKLTVRRTSVGYHTTHTEDAAAEQTLSSAPNSPHHQEEPKSPEERTPKTEVSVEPEHTQLSESCEDSDSNENFADKKGGKSALRCHADPTLPTWASDSCATSQDCWGRKSPDANQTPSSANSLAMDDDVAMTTVFPTMSGIRPSSALENNSPSAMDLDGSRDARDEEDTRTTPETSTWKPQQCSTRAEEENEINAAVASITQLDAASPLVTADYSGAAILDEQPSPHPIEPPLIRLDRHDDAQEMLSHDDEAQTASNDVEQNLLNDNDEAQNPPNNENQDEIMLTYDEGGEKLLTRDAEQPMLSQDDTAQSPDESMERTIIEEKFLESSALHSSGEFPSNMGEMQGFDPQSELPLGTTSQPLATASQPLATAPQQCNFNEAPYSGEFVSTNSEPLQIQTYQSELAFQCQQQSGGYQDNGNLQQPLYESDTQRMYNASCMGSQPPPPQHDVIDENNQAVMTSPKPSYAQQVSQTTMAAPACHASVVQVHPQGSQHPQVHPAYPPAPGGSGSTSGYETLSNNSCSPYTSPESLNPGSCDHNTITTTASATFTPEQAGIPLGAGPMSVGVQQHLQANFPPSIDSGHGSEYLSSPPSLGVSSTQGTPPKPSVVPQQTLMSPEPSFPQARQQLNSAGSYNNLSSPNMTQQNTNMTQQSRPSCAVGDPLHPPQNLNLMPCMIQQQRSPSVSKTPTTPQCGFPRAEEGFGGNVEPRHPPDPSPPHTAPSSLMKLQKLTRQISVESPSATNRAPLGKGAFPAPQTHLRRPRYTGVPERPSSVQPPVIPSMEKPHPSTPPAGMVDRPRDGYYGNKDPYARVNTLASGEYPYNWEQGVQHFPRHNPSYPTYEQSWPPGAFGTYPGYSTQAPHCQLERQYTSQKFTHPSGGNYPQNTPHNSMLMNPNRQTWGGRDPYEQGSGYEGLVVRPPFPTHEMHPRPPNLHPYYSGPTYPGYTNQGGYNNSFPHR